MGNISQKDIEIIESYIKNCDSIFDEKIKFEYKFLKNYKEPELNETNLNKVKSYLKGTKIILNPILQKKNKTTDKMFQNGNAKRNEIKFLQNELVQNDGKQKFERFEQIFEQKRQKIE